MNSMYQDLFSPQAILPWSSLGILSLDLVISY